MSKKKLAVAAGILVLAGGAVAIAAVGDREGRMGHRERHHGMDDLAQMHEHGRGEGRWGGRHGRHHDEDSRDGIHGRDMRRGWLGRSVTADDFDARTRERFARIDRNSDGVIDAAEVEAEITARGEGRRGERRDGMHRRHEARFDTDRDGKISRAEVLERVKRDFARMDLDRDGRITDADLPPMMRGRDMLKGRAGVRGHGGMGMGMGMGFGQLMAADANGDGVITLEEAQAQAGRRFDLADRNKDGTVDTTDREALRKETVEYRVRRFLHAHGAGQDGRLTREQFMKSAKERFAERDLNADGRIDREDRRGGPGMGHGGGRGMGPAGPGTPDRGPPR
jgi:Ca2+-binding EF-hand superfamily protein